MFMFDRQRRERRVWNWSTQATGEVVCASALVRYLSTFCTLRVVALDTVCKSSRTESWEGIPVFIRNFATGIGDEDCDVCIAVSTAPTLVVAVAASHAPVKLVFAHEHLTLPWGSWAVAHDSGYASLLAKTTLLCASTYILEYVCRSAPAEQRAVICYAADYGVFGNPPEPDPGSYVLCVSPCPAKGIDILCALARSMPTVAFAAVATKWTKDTDKQLLAALPNVRLLAGFPHERIDDLFAQTRVLLAPSIWPEPYGLVAIEAALRGIPVLSTDHGGLTEANFAHKVSVPLVHDIRRQQTFVASSLGDYETRPESCRKATLADFARAADVFRTNLEPLLDSDTTAFRRLARQARDQARAHLCQRNHKLAHLLLSYRAS